MERTTVLLGLAFGLAALAFTMAYLLSLLVWRTWLKPHLWRTLKNRVPASNFATMIEKRNRDFFWTTYSLNLIIGDIEKLNRRRARGKRA